MLSRQKSLFFRILAITMVLISHYAAWWEWFHPLSGTPLFIQQCLAKLGPYGVDIFFLCSGYAFVKSVSDTGISISFLTKKIFSVYLPYLIIGFCLDLLSESPLNAASLLSLITGQDFWFMHVYFILCLLFFVVWMLCRLIPQCPLFLNVVIYTLCVAIASVFMAVSGKNDFWFISNAAMVIGVVLSCFENQWMKCINKYKYLFLTILSAMLMVAVKKGISIPASYSNPNLYISQVVAGIIFSLWTVVLIGLIPYPFERRLLLGRSTLYIYLTHTAIFMWVINTVPGTWYLAKFILAIVLTIFVSCIFCIAYEAFLKKVYSLIYKQS